MMTTTTMLYARAGAAAIAAVLALSSNPLAAQEAPAPVTVTPETTTPAMATPAPVTTDTPADPTAATETPAATDDPLAPTSSEASTASKSTTKSVRTAAKRSAPTKAAVATAAPAKASTVSRAAASATPAAPTIAASTAQAPAPVAEAPAPVEPAATQASAPAAKPATNSNDTMLELGGGALALLALGGAAVALNRRRHRDGELMEEETWVEEPMAEDAPVPEPEVLAAPARVYEEQPAIVGPDRSAFAWGNSQPASTAVTADDGSDRRAGESWVDRAYRGPSPANPSVSLRNRLRRAAFFDKREREVAAGEAAPVETDAGLPEAAVDEREFA